MATQLPQMSQCGVMRWQQPKPVSHTCLKLLKRIATRRLCIVLCSALFISLSINPVYADHCPADRPHHRGTDACDSCDAQEVRRQYDEGELSTTRESRLFDHEVRVSVYCDANRPIDVDDVFMKIDATEEKFYDLFRRVIDLEDGLVLSEDSEDPMNEESGTPKLLEVVIGICDYDEEAGLDDCAMYPLCTSKFGSSCNVVNGQAFRNSPGEATHITYVPYLPEGNYYWVEGNRYSNLLHEFTHLMDYAYFRVAGPRDPDTRWWVEGLAQYVQWLQLHDQISWDRGNDEATILDVLTSRSHTSDYYDGLRIFAYLAENSPWLMERAAISMRAGVYTSPETHLDWHSLLGYIAWRHQPHWFEWIEKSGTDLVTFDTSNGEAFDWPVRRENP